MDEYHRLLKEALEPHVKTLLAGVHRAAAMQYYVDYVVPVTHYLRAIEFREDNKQAMYIGAGLGVVVLVFLVMFPGEEYDYSKEKGTSKRPEGNGNCSKSSGADLATTSGSGKKKKGRKKDKAGCSVEAPGAVALAGAAEPAGGAAASLRTPSSYRAAGAEEETRTSRTKEEDPFASPELQEQARKAARVMGLSEEQVAKAIANAKVEFETGQAPPSEYSNAAAAGVSIGFEGWLRLPCWLLMTRGGTPPPKSTVLRVGARGLVLACFSFGSPCLFHPTPAGVCQLLFASYGARGGDLGCQP